MGDCSNSLDWVPEQEKSILLVKVVHLEAQLWKCVQTTGLMSTEAQLLYKQVCSCFEKLVLCDMEFIEIQDVEYSLWKLHYRYIDEFRKRVAQRGNSKAGSPRPPRPQNGTAARQNDINHVDAFKLLLSEATKFYQDLLVKVRECYGFLENKSGMVIRREATVRSCQFLCHRFLICIGDLARYKELSESNDVRKRNWSVSATYYMKATVIWPDGGNSHNQLALLATYVGDEFLALYHCVRSLAVKEQFPDAWNNLLLLFEKNQSTFLPSVSNEVRFDFSNPSARTNLLKKFDKNDSGKTEIWHLFIKLIGFFLTENRSEDFLCILGSTLVELDALMELDDTKLKASLESYQQMGTSRAGPFRALQIVAVLIFVVNHVPEHLKQTALESVNSAQQLESIRLSLVATLVCIGHLIDRCLKSSSVNSCPLLPGVLVFLEWLAAEVDKLDAHCEDWRVLKACQFFFDRLVRLLNLIQNTRANGISKFSSVTALWEDFELQGFVPLTKAHNLLDFSDQIGHRKNFENGKNCRITRICSSAARLAGRTRLSRHWLCYNPLDNTFSVTSQDNSSELSNPEPRPTKIGQIASGIEYISDAVDEEEVILFNPIVRHNSAPIQKCADKESLNSVTNEPQQGAMDECVRRSKSLLITESQLNTGSLEIKDRDSQLKTAPLSLNPMFFVPDKLHEKPEISKESTPSHKFSENNNAMARGPPSLNAWVIEQGSSSTDRPNELDNICKSYRKPIEVAANKSFSPLSVTTSMDSVTHWSQFSPASPKYSNIALPPMAPRFSPLPNERVSDVSSSYISSPRLIHDPVTTSVSGTLSTATPTSPGRHQPLSGMLTSSEWLRQYREKHGQKQHPQISPTNLPARSYTPPRTYTNSADASAIELYDRWGNPIVSVPKMNLPVPQPFSDLGKGQLWETHAPNTYGFVNEVEDEQRPLLQYLKEREMWKMQQKQHLRSRSPPPAYMKS